MKEQDGALCVYAVLISEDASALVDCVRFFDDCARDIDDSAFLIYHKVIF